MRRGGPWTRAAAAPASEPCAGAAPASPGPGRSGAARAGPARGGRPGGRRRSRGPASAHWAAKRPGAVKQEATAIRSWPRASGRGRRRGRWGRRRRRRRAPPGCPRRAESRAAVRSVSAAERGRGSRRRPGRPRRCGASGVLRVPAGLQEAAVQGLGEEGVRAQRRGDGVRAVGARPPARQVVRDVVAAAEEQRDEDGRACAGRRGCRGAGARSARCGRAGRAGRGGARGPGRSSAVTVRRARGSRLPWATATRAGGGRRRASTSASWVWSWLVKRS